MLLELRPALLAEQHLGRPEIFQQLAQVGRVALGKQKLTRADVEKRNAGLRFAKMHGAEVVVGPALQSLVVHAHTGRYQLGYSPLHQPFGLLGVFELVADGHALPGPHEFGQIRVQRVVREAGQRRFGSRAGPALGERNIQQPGRRDGILAEGFVKITHPKQQQRPRVLLLELIVLPHERRVELRHWAEVVGPDGLDRKLILGRSRSQRRSASFSLRKS